MYGCAAFAVEKDAYRDQFQSAGKFRSAANPPTTRKRGLAQTHRLKIRKYISKTENRAFHIVKPIPGKSKVKLFHVLAEFFRSRSLLDLDVSIHRPRQSAL